MALKVVLSRRLRATTQKKAGELIKAGGVYVNRLRVRVPTVRVAEGERVTVYPGADEIERIRGEDLRFVLREQGFCVIDKPAGVAAEATRESCRGTIADALLQMMTSEGVQRPYVGLLHRVQARGSGLLLFTTRGHETRNALAAFSSTSIEPTYRLLTRGGPETKTTVKQPLVKTRSGEWRLPRDEETGEPLETRFEPIGPACDPRLTEARVDSTEAECVRLHARAMGFPVVGDEEEGELALCCTTLSFGHPETGKRVSLAARLPAWARAD